MRLVSKPSKSKRLLYTKQHLVCPLNSSDIIISGHPSRISFNVEYCGRRYAVRLDELETQKLIEKVAEIKKVQADETQSH